jgi:hypothetical protein
MWNELLTRWLRRLGGVPCFRIYGKARPEAAWRTIEVYASGRRNFGSRWPLWRGTCTTWTASIIAVGWDFAAQLMGEQAIQPASRQHPVKVAGGRIRDHARRGLAGPVSASEILAHECGHTWQALRLGAAYLPLVGPVTLFREGPRWWNHFENQASEQGQFGGLVNGSVCTELMNRLEHDSRTHPAPG